MKLVFISDTHGLHQKLKDLNGDIIIHAGDVSGRGKKAEIVEFLNWYGALDFKYKIFIAGNHDFYFEQASEREIKELIPDDIIYLNDSGTTIDNLNIWGSPIQPTFYNWAFNRDRGVDIKKHWDLIPEYTDILITHGPPFGILDKTTTNLNVGCEELQKRLLVVKPKIHVFGHIHEEYGIMDLDNTTFINASMVNQAYQVVNLPIELELEGDESCVS